MFLKIKRPLSLSLQLSLWYTSVCFLLLLLGSGWMYLQLVRAYDASEADFLLRKALTLKELARQQDLPILRWEIAGSYLDGRPRPRAGSGPSAPFALTLARVLSPGGSIMIETDRMSEQIPTQSFPREGPLNGTYRGRLFRMLAMTSPEGFRIQVARDYTLQENIVASYRRKLWMFLGIGLLLSAPAGFMIARHGMGPVEEIADTLQRIGSRTLGERVKTVGLPAELSLLASTFNQTLDRLEDAFGRMASFSSDIAHELRTPIGNLRGESEVALSRARTVEEYREVLESSLEEYLRLSQIIDRLLFLARAENPATEIHREPVDLGKELQKVCEFYEAAASDASIDLGIVTHPSFVAGVDRTLLQRALSNLIENSLAHTSAGGHIRLEAVRSNGSLLISVADDGCGIATEHLTRVFDRFYRIDRARSQNKGGAGLGLAIVKSVASMHGGEAGIDSTVGKGTRVTLRLPVA